MPYFTTADEFGKSTMQVHGCMPWSSESGECPSSSFPVIEHLCALWSIYQPTMHIPSNGMTQADAHATKLQTVRHVVHPPRDARPTRHTPSVSAHGAWPARKLSSTSPLASESSAAHGNGSTARPHPQATIDRSLACRTRDHGAHGPRRPTPGPCCRAELEEFFGMPCIGKAPLESEHPPARSPDSDGMCQQSVSPDLCNHLVSMRVNTRLDAADTREAASRSPRLREVLIRLQERR